MTQLLSLFGFIFDNRNKSKNLEKPITAKGLQTVKRIKHSVLNLYDAWIEASQWAGTIHIATHTQEVEFGVIVALLHRRQGIANIMIDQAITWARNRFYTDLYMHCIERNSAIKRLCQKHDLKVRNMMGDSEADLVLLPPTPLTFLKEQLTTQYNLLAKFFPYQYSHQ